MSDIRPRRSGDDRLHPTIERFRSETRELSFREFASLLNTLRDTEAGEMRRVASDLWGELVRIADAYRDLTGAPFRFDTPPEAVFGEDSPTPAAATPETVSVTKDNKPDAWYEHTLITLVNQLQGHATTDFLEAVVVAMGGEAQGAQQALQRLSDSGPLVQAEGVWRNVTQRPESWYDHTILSFLHESPNHEPRTVKEVHDHCIERGANGHAAVTRHLPRLISAGAVCEPSEGRFQPGNVRSDTWYDHIILSFIADSPADGLPSTKAIHDHCIAQGGHGASAVKDALPRLLTAGVIREAEPGVWDVTNRRSEAWYDHAVMGTLDEHDGPASAKTIHDRVIASGGNGAKAVAEHLPRLLKAGRLVQPEEGVFDRADRRSETWYDHAIIGFLRDATDAGASVKAVHDRVIAQGGNGAVAVTQALPRLEKAGVLREVSEGVFDITDRKPDAWYHNVIVTFVTNFGDEFPTTKVIHDHCIKAGGNGAHAVTRALPSLANAGLLREVEEGSWDLGTGTPIAWYTNELLGLLDATEDNTLSEKDIAEHIFQAGGCADEAMTTAMPRLIEQGLVSRVGRNVYALATADEAETSPRLRLAA
jgi:DNA-binding transcriptional ArsR family regulator